MSWYIWGVTSFDVPLLLDQSLICMKFSRYILFCKLLLSEPMEMERFELLTPCLQGRCSPNWATPPFGCLTIFNFQNRSFERAWVDSNHRPHAYQACALTGWATSPFQSGIHLLSHAVSSIVPSAAQVLTIVFGMGTGVSPERIDTRNMKLSFW